MRSFIAVILSMAIAVVASSAVSAHVVVTPKTVAPASYVTFNVSVPNERDVATTEVELLIPASLGSVKPTVNGDWQVTVAKEGDNVESITWRGSIPVDQRADLTFSAQAPASATTLDWKAYQTYQDGVVVKWDQTPTDTSETPFSVTKVADAEASGDRVERAQSTANMALVVSVAAIVISVGSLFVGRRKSKNR